MKALNRDDLRENRMLEGAVRSKSEECKAGMYPIDDGLKEWLKKELGL
ncbi:MAG: hypothetical protein AABY44_05560 [Nitrospirota bacterium]